MGSMDESSCRPANLAHALHGMGQPLPPFLFVHIIMILINYFIILYERVVVFEYVLLTGLKQ